MRLALLVSTLLIAGAPLAVPAPAAAQPPAYGVGPTVSVSVSPEFADRARRKLIGARDLDQLERDLHRVATRALERAGQGGPVRADLVLIDAEPNRPTFDQLGRSIGLSYSSRGLGGAWVGGTVTFADGRTAPVDYRFYETDLRNDFSLTTWGDAERAFDQFAGRLQRGDLRPYHFGEPERNGGSFGLYPYGN